MPVDAHPIAVRLRFSWRRLILLAGLTAAFGAESLSFTPANNQTLTLQLGNAGYSGVRDTWISSDSWDNPPQYGVNYGQNGQLQVNRGDSPLLRFDLSAIPSSSQVISATLYLYGVTSGQLLPRRVNLFRVLKDWDEGTEINSPINAAGKHGATGDHAFAYFPGEGTSVPWSQRAMSAGVDYAAAAESFADLLGPGWYSWDVTAAVRGWVRADFANFGMNLRDGSGWIDGDLGWRNFVSSQGSSADQRPKLVISYNPATPFASAGADLTNRAWQGGPIWLDGSASHDRPGGNNATLSYSWRILRAGYGSALSGTLPLATASGWFTPDVAGRWLFELTVTNDLGEQAQDSVQAELLSIPAGHPRVHLNAAQLAALQARATPANPLWTQLVIQANRNDYDVNDWGNVMQSSALVGLVTGQEAYCSKAIGIADMKRNADTGYGRNGNGSLAGTLALVYDWCNPQLSEPTRSQMIAYFNTWGDKQKWGASDPDTFAYGGPGWGNYWNNYGYSFALIGLATWGENPRAAEWLDEYRQVRIATHDLPVLDRIAQGGAWPEGTVYDWIANPRRLEAVDAWRSGTGENLILASTWFQERLGYLLLQNFPGVEAGWYRQFHPYISMGDAERHRDSIENYRRGMALILVRQFADDPSAAQLQAYLSAPPANVTGSSLYYQEFLWYDPNIASTVPTRVTNYAPALGQLLLRSGWPSGAADTNSCATYITFNAGDHFSYHQHLDQNSFTLFKCGDLAIDSGVYSGNGLSYHDANYYVRTIAHNTLVVYNPGENLKDSRTDAVSNDGGQRSMYPASRSPETVAYWDQYATQYDTGDILRLEDAQDYTYAFGDATKAYNNPQYYQAQNTSYTQNVPKVTRFQREFVYLRPRAPENALSNDFLVLYDRVGVASTSFSLANTKLLFHTLGMPTVDGTPTVISPGETLHAAATEAVAAAGSGKLFLKVLAPAQRNLRVVGGRGVKSFWVFGQNYDWHWSADEAQPRPISDYDPLPYGEWRMELEPADDALDHNFLTVLYPTSSTTAGMPPTTLVSGPGLAGAHIADPSRNRVVLFSSAADGSAIAGTISYSYQPTATTTHLILDLTPGSTYNLTATLNNGTQVVTLTPAVGGAYKASSQGALSFVLLVQPQQHWYLPLVIR